MSDDFYPPAPDAAAEQVPLLDLFLVFAGLGAMSFGGGVLSWLHHEVVFRRRWLDDRDYLAALGIATILPGPNPVNVSVHVGMKLRGARGAFLAVIGLILPPFVIILMLGLAYGRLRAMPVTGFILAGLAASGVGTSLSAGTRLALRLPRNVATAAIAVGVFVTSAFLRWHIAQILIIAAPLAIATNYYRLSERR
jgi:chromate transporter